MKHEAVSHDVEYFGIEEKKVMRIANSGKMFHTLISGLYSRKIESIVRESCSNAKDGHIRQGNTDRPFRVHAPTSWEPYYAVRDFGCSMDHTMVMDLYSTVGWSSKEDSNEENGTFGLGSKAPFAYTPQFTVTCWTDGLRRIYNCHLDDVGQPIIALMGEPEASEEEQGVEVRFDVKNHDIMTFKTAISAVALAHVPCFECNTTVRSAVITRDYGNFFRTDDTQRDGPFVQIGCVWYKIDFSSLPDTHQIAGFRADKTLVLRAPIGTLGIVPSRESLQYTDKTINSLVDQITNLYNFHVQEVQSEIDKLTTVWEAARYFEQKQQGDLYWVIADQTPTKFGKHSDFSFFPFHALGEYVGKVTRNTSIKSCRYDPKTKVFRRGGGQSACAVYVMDQKLHHKLWRMRINTDMANRKIAEAVLVTLPDTATVSALAASMNKRGVMREERERKLRGLFEQLRTVRANAPGLIAEYGCPDVIDVASLPEAKMERKERSVDSIICYKTDAGRKWTPTHHHGEKFVSKAPDEIDVVFPLTRGKAFDDINVATMRAALKHYKDMHLRHVFGVGKSYMKLFMAAHPHLMSSADVFNKREFDMAAVEARVRELESVALRDISSDSFSYADELAAICTRLEQVPAAITSFIETVRHLRDENARARAVMKSGPTMDTCQWLATMVTGKQIAWAVKEDTTDQQLQDAMDALDADMPGLRHVVRFSDMKGRHINPVAYILGLELVKAQGLVEVPAEPQGVEPLVRCGDCGENACDCDCDAFEEAA